MVLFRVAEGNPTDRLVHSAGLALLYVGISPKRPRAVGSLSRQTLRSRLRYHFQGNAEYPTTLAWLSLIAGFVY
jgi:GIY-YIG catalytic domain-containing protein